MIFLFHLGHQMRTLIRGGKVFYAADQRRRWDFVKKPSLAASIVLVSVAAAFSHCVTVLLEILVVYVDEIWFSEKEVEEQIAFEDEHLYFSRNHAIRVGQ